MPIEQLQVGDRVATDVSAAGTPGGPPPVIGDGNSTNVDPATWRLVTLTMPDPNEPGNDYQMKLLEPDSWIAQNRAVAGHWVDLSLPELQISGNAVVVSVEPCPAIRQGPGRVILGTFQHISHDLVEVHLVNQVVPMQVTSGHMLWSADRSDWVAAATLLPGERLVTEHVVEVVASVVEKPGAAQVYNLDVESDHRYLVGDSAVVAHNANPWCLEGYDKKMFNRRFGNFYRNPHDGTWWSVDNAGHGGSAFKVFKETATGLEWIADADQTGKFLTGKHKGPIGLFIRWSSLRSA